jgi:hypothetical protein
MHIQLFTEDQDTSLTAAKMLQERMISFELFPVKRHTEVCRMALLYSQSNEFPVLKICTGKKTEWTAGKAVIDVIRDLRFGEG